MAATLVATGHQMLLATVKVFISPSLWVFVYLLWGKGCTSALESNNTQGEEGFYASTVL